jgi:hypothetical protein
MVRLQDERVKQVAIGGGILLMITLLVTGTWVGWRMLPGLLGEWIGFMVGIMTTPFCMETSFVIIGAFIVISLNHWRRQRDGDEFVDLDDIQPAEVEAQPEDHDRQTPIS